MKRLFLIAVLLCVFLSTGCWPGTDAKGDAGETAKANAKANSDSNAGKAQDATADTRPDSADAAPSSIVDWADVIRFEGITYLAADSGVGRPLRKSDLGPKFAEVKLRLQDDANSQRCCIKNGDAAYLDVGTPVYEVNGYDPSFRLAANDGKALKLYEVLVNYRAEEGADYLDIEGKVRYIGIEADARWIEPRPGIKRTELAAIKNREEVRSLVATIMEAPLIVEPGSFPEDGKVYFLAFHLEDGTATVQTYYADRNGMYFGISLPEEFRRTIERAVSGRIS